MPAIELTNVEKTHTLRASRARGLKHALLSMFKKRGEAETVHALRGISLSVPEGRSVGIIGANGAGKTSLLRLIAGISEPTSGEIKVDGRVLPMLELGAGFHPDLSGYENIFLQGILLGLERRRIEELLDSIIDFAELREFIHQPVRHYSSGMYMRLGFAISIHVDPDILLIDEAFSVGDSYFQEKCFQKIREFHQQGRTLLLVTHEIAVVERICDEAIWIDKGRIVARGNPPDVAHQYRRAMFDLSFPQPIPMAFRDQVAVGGGRFGTGAVTFDYLDFVDENGHLCNTFENGRAMEIRLRYRVRDPLPETDCMITIHSYRGHGAACIFTREMRQTIPLHAEGGEISFRIDRLDFAPGRYLASVALLKGNVSDVNDFYDFHLRIYSFTVAQRPELTQTAGVEIPCRWEHAPLCGAI